MFFVPCMTDDDKMPSAMCMVWGLGFKGFDTHTRTRLAWLHAISRLKPPQHTGLGV